MVLEARGQYRDVMGLTLPLAQQTVIGAGDTVRVRVLVGQRLCAEAATVDAAVVGFARTLERRAFVFLAAGLLAGLVALRPVGLRNHEHLRFVHRDFAVVHQ